MCDLIKKIYVYWLVKKTEESRKIESSLKFYLLNIYIFRGANNLEIKNT